MTREQAREYDIANRIIASCSIAMVIIHAGGTVWWASKMDTRVSGIEKWIDSRASVMSDARVARIEERIDAICKGQGETKAKLDNIADMFMRHMGAEEGRSNVPSNGRR